MTIDLDSPEWATLADAYGSAAEIPSLLRRLQKEDVGALEELYSRICHQGSVYSVSFAALPHLVQTAKNIGDVEFRADVLSLVGAIYESPYFPEDSTTAAMRETITESVDIALELAVESLPDLEDTIASIYLWKSAAAFAGFIGPARVLEGFVDEEFYLDCPNCETELFIWPSEDGLTTAAEDPVSNPDTEQIPVTTGPIPESPQYGAFNLLSRLANTAPSLSNVSAQLPHLFGVATCPACKSEFSLMDALVENESQ